MGRLVAALLAIAALAGVFFLPGVSRARLACLSAHEILNEQIDPEDADSPTLAELVLTGPGAVKKPEGGTEVTVNGVRLGADEASEAEMNMNIVLRRSLVRGLRQYAGEEHQPLTVVGEGAPRQEEGGVNFYLQVVGNQRMLEYTVHQTDVRHLQVLDWTPPEPTSVLPPVVAVALAVLFRRPVLALFAGVLCGAFLLRRAADASIAASAGGGLIDVFQHYFWNEFVEPERFMIVGFVVFMLAMVGVMTRAGGIRGLMDRVARLAHNAKRTQVATFLMGLAVFFDDYANTILVGSTMRPLTDRFRVAREKLAYIVDSTAAPVAGLSIFSTWIAFEVSTFSAQLPAAGLDTGDGYVVFLRTIPYSFYCLLALVFVALVVFTGRDMGPMLRAERRARTTGELVAPGAKPMVSEEATALEAAPGIAPRAWRALVPLAVFIAATLLWIFYQGGAFDLPPAELFTIEGMTGVLYDGSGSMPLVVGSGLGFLVATLAAFLAGLGTDVPRAAWTTIRAMWIAFAILYLAWMIGAVCGDLGTAPYLTALVGDSLDPRLLPSLLFLLAGLVAFATGSSWSTMSILLPLVVGLAYNLGVDTGLAETARESGQLLMAISIAATLSGAIFGDHCSPISDTTVMSSIASASDHIDHVRTQAPYALLVMLVAVFAGYMPVTYYGLSPLTCLGIGALALVFLIFVFGKKVETDRI